MELFVFDLDLLTLEDHGGVLLSSGMTSSLQAGMRP